MHKAVDAKGNLNASNEHKCNVNIKLHMIFSL